MYNFRDTLGIPVERAERKFFEIDSTAAQSAIEKNHNPQSGWFALFIQFPTGNALTSTELEWLRSLPEQIL